MMATKTYPTVGELVTAQPGRSRIFERLGIDYCCGGKRTLDVACSEKGLDVDTLLATLQAFDLGAPVLEIDWTKRSLCELCDNIERQHHDYLREELPRLNVMLDKLVKVHGHEHPELTRIHDIFVQFRGELEFHMAKEEQVLFPAIRTVEQTQQMPCFHCGTLDAPIDILEGEHEAAGQALKQFRQLSNNYTVPSDACNTYRAAYDALAKLERDMHEHVSKENNILFPRAIALVKSLESE